MRVSTASLLSSLGLLSTVTALWPRPLVQHNGTDVVYFDASKVKYSFMPLKGNGGYKRDTQATTDTDVVNGALNRFSSDLQKAAYDPWKFYKPGTNYNPADNSSAPYLTSVVIQQVPAKQGSNITAGEKDETYTLDLASNGTALIKAASVPGALHGLTSLLQLWYKTSQGNKVYTNLAPIHIEDGPKYPHRGINIDFSRNYQPPEFVKRTIDAMALAKFNVIHLHATDSQSWPLDIPSLPELAQKGAYAAGLAWSAQDLDSVQAYAVARGIEPIIEIDTPGHTSSIAQSHPDLIAAFNAQPWTQYCAEPPCGTLQLNNKGVYSLFSKILDDLLPRTKKYSRFFHSGGDEVNANAYSLDPTVKSNSTSVIQPLIQKFKSFLEDKIKAQKLVPMVWEEMIITWNLTLAPETVVQTWQGQESIAAVTDKGYRALFGDYFHWYVDCGYGQWIDPNTTAIADGTSLITPPYTDYCNPLKSWREMYAYDPRENLTAAQTGLLYGGEAHMWAELTDPINFDSKLWPRALAPAEVMWSGPTGIRGVDEGVTRRMSDLRERLVALGYGANPVQMTFCLQNPGSCTA